MNNNINFKLLSGSAVILMNVIGFSGTATAQGAESQMASASDHAADIENDTNAIVVTAQKRSERLQDVPISIAAFSGETLDRNNVISVQDLGRITTNFSASTAAQASAVRLAVRGIGSAGNNATEPSVAAFVDGVYVPRVGSIIGNFLDIEGVEILRGPQGTLFGRNASVGAVSLRTAQPEFDFSGKVGAEYGTGNRFRLTGHVNVPLNDKVAVRFAGLGSWKDGFWRNRLDGKTYGGSDDYAGRVTVKAELGNVTWLLRGDYSRSDGDGYAMNDFKFDSVSTAQVDGFIALQESFSGTSFDNVLFDREFNHLVTSDYRDRHWGVSSDLSLDTGGYTLRLINSYRDWNSGQLDGDNFSTPVSLLSRFTAFASKSQSHELQFISPKDELLGGALDFVAGLYYFAEDYDIEERLQLGDEFCNFLVPAASRPACNGTLASGGGVDATNQDFSQSVNSVAAYGQLTLKLADPLRLTLGGRWTRDDKKATYIQTVANPFAGGLRAPENANLKLTEDRFTWRASLNYQPNRDVMIFANYSTGYKSGGFNSGSGAAALNQSRIFGRETVDNYEVGAKTTWLDGTLTANATLFRMDIGGFQDRSFDGTSFVVRNAGNLRHQGVEFDTILRPSRRFSVNASVAYLDSKFTRYPGASGLPGLGGVQDLKGAPNNFAAEWSGNVGANWDGTFGNTDWGWSLNGNISFISDVNTGGVTDNNPQTVQDGYALISARFSINTPDDRWKISVFGDNLTNKGYCSTQFYQVLDGALGLRNGKFPGSTGVRCYLGNPRTYGVSASVQF
jgi:iron complex outermembrane receptor protein